MDNILRLPLPLYVVAVVLFSGLGTVFLLAEGHWSAAFLNLVGIAYAIGLGCVVLWRRLGRPAVPTSRGRTAQRPDGLALTHPPRRRLSLGLLDENAEAASRPAGAARSRRACRGE